MERLLLAGAAAVGAPVAVAVYVALIERLLALAPPAWRGAARPWLWLAPALALLLTFLVYPTLATVRLSFLNASGTASAGPANYQYLLSDPVMLTALRNNLVWLLTFTAGAVGLGLLIAVLADRAPYEGALKSVVFLPMAISFTAAGVIWRLVYNYRPPGAPQTGTLNGLLTALLPSFEPQAWLINVPWNTLALIAAAVWIWTGFCTVILSAALKGIDESLLEAARVDGAGEWQAFRHVVLPLLGPTLAVTATTMVITALKAFDIVYVMTNGNFDTEVIANRMYKEMFNIRDFGRASAIAVVLLAAALPVMAINVRRFRRHEEGR